MLMLCRRIQVGTSKEGGKERKGKEGLWVRLGIIFVNVALSSMYVCY